LLKPARVHAKYLGDSGKCEHVDAKGKDYNDRCKPYAKADYFMECVNCGTGDGLDSVIALIVDDGVESRGH